MNRLPVQVIYFSFFLKSPGTVNAALMLQHPLLAAQEKAFLKERLPSFIHDLWRIPKSDYVNIPIEAMSDDVQQKTAEFGHI